MKIILVCTLFVGVFKISEQQCLTPNDMALPNRNVHKGLYSGQQEFSLALLKAINQLNPQENIFFSPYSTYHALLLAYFISSNHTEAYLKSTLRLDPQQSKSDIFSAYKLDKFATGLRAVNSSYEFTNANRIYVAQQVALRQCITSIFEELVQANFQEQADVVRNEINHWVENQTHNMIKDLLPAGSIDAATNLVLVNAAYFKGVWENKFDVKETQPEIFYISPSKQTMVDMMHLEATLNYDVSETLQAHILELPYQGEDISMYILLPPFSKPGESEPIETVLKNLNLENFRSVVNGSLLPRQVQVSLPKFSLEHKIELVPILERIGVGDLFKSSSDLSTLAINNDVDLGSAIHQAKIEVNEQGTKAAAATAFVTFRSSRPLEPAKFVCNHPFVYVIFDKVEQSILFTGVFRRPH